MIERFIILTGILFGLFSFRTLTRKPSIKIWLPLYFFNRIMNYCFNKALVIE